MDIGEDGKVDEVVISAAEAVTRTRQTLRDALRAMGHNDPDFGLTLLTVHEMGVVSASDLAQWVGLSRSRMYDHIRDARRLRGES